MSLGYRLKRLIKSDMHALVEGLEDPKWVLAQALRDMEEELEKIEADLGVRRNHWGKIKDRLIANQAITTALENDIEFAMQEKREDIAKNLIRKLILTRRNLEDLVQKDKVFAEDLVNVEEDYRLKKGAYEDVRGRCEVLNLKRIDDDAFQAAARLVSEDGRGDTSIDQQVEIEFLRRLQKEKEENHEISS